MCNDIYRKESSSQKYSQTGEVFQRAFLCDPLFLPSFHPLTQEEEDGLRVTCSTVQSDSLTRFRTDHSSITFHWAHPSPSPPPHRHGTIPSDSFVQQKQRERRRKSALNRTTITVHLHSPLQSKGKFCNSFPIKSSPWAYYMYRSTEEVNKKGMPSMDGLQWLIRL